MFLENYGIILETLECFWKGSSRVLAGYVQVCWAIRIVAYLSEIGVPDVGLEGTVARHAGPLYCQRP